MPIELDIYGDGYLREYVESKCNDQIHYYGRIDNEKMLEVQRHAWLLANPRPVDDPIAKVTFPSKIFEYLMSGVPVLSTRLNGFSEDYNNLLIFVNDNSPESLAEGIRKADKLNKEELTAMAKMARDYLVSHKTWDKQVRRIVEFIDWNSHMSTDRM